MDDTISYPFFNIRQNITLGLEKCSLCTRSRYVLYLMNFQLNVFFNRDPKSKTTITSLINSNFFTLQNFPFDF